MKVNYKFEMKVAGLHYSDAKSVNVDALDSKNFHTWVLAHFKSLLNEYSDMITKFEANDGDVFKLQCNDYTYRLMSPTEFVGGKDNEIPTKYVLSDLCNDNKCADTCGCVDTRGCVQKERDLDEECEEVVSDRGISIFPETEGCLEEPARARFCSLVDESFKLFFNTDKIINLINDKICDGDVVFDYDDGEVTMFIVIDAIPDFVAYKVCDDLSDNRYNVDFYTDDTDTVFTVTRIL